VSKVGGIGLHMTWRWW